MEEGAVSKKLVEGGNGTVSVAGPVKKTVGVEENPMIGQSSYGGVAATPTVHAQIESTSILSENTISNIDILAESLRKAGTMFMCDQSAVKATEQCQGAKPDELEDDVEMPTASKKRGGRPRSFLEEPASLKDKTPSKEPTPKRRRGRPKKKVRKPRKRSLEEDEEAATSSPKRMKEQTVEDTGCTPVEGGSNEVPKKRGPGRPRKSDKIKASTARTPSQSVTPNKCVKPKRNSSSANNKQTVVDTEDGTPDRSPEDPAASSPAVISSPRKTGTEEEMEAIPTHHNSPGNSPGQLPEHHRDSPMKNVRTEKEGKGKDVDSGSMEKMQVSGSESDGNGSREVKDGT